MKTTSLDKQLEEIIRNISGVSIDDIDKVFKALMMFVIMQYSEGEIIKIPYFGALKINFENDVLTKEGRIANLSTSYFPSNEIKLNIGMLEDVKNGKSSILDVPCIKDKFHNIKTNLSKITE